MKILALETSAKSVSAAVVENGRILCSAYQNTGLTHSRTLMPLVDGMLRAADLTTGDMDLIAVAQGPGSFTGLRIGVSAAKGLAWAQEIPCCGVSTLLAMAQNLRHMDALVVCAMDARRNQVYNALFRAENGVLTRLSEDRAISLAELADELKNDETAKIIVGDGAQLCYTYLKEQGIDCRMAPEALVMQSAVGVALAAEELAAEGKTVTAHELVPVYLRLSQAERERLAKGLKITVD
ncbi:MAG: tRNA (adenosine(37)-N6)-threonylcarbamoyltransferase complex dimerization subunit type 1 TsaB [Ruminococcaceae bacterium]|nr:tRNA (adenosine(37)-N6)-threonylcarbamoyltransferase complex dimerization subunit type 1 TsaB [Oscillospiraceae bacterium]